MVDLEKYFTVYGTWEQGSNDLVSVTGSLSLKSTMDKLPFRFDKVSGDFEISACRLTTLDGCPSFVGGQFVASYNLFENLEGGPHTVKGAYNVRKCANLTRLDGLAEDIGGLFSVDYQPDLPLLRSLVSSRIDLSPRDANTWVLTQKRRTAEEILNRYAGQGAAGAFACGAELASAGYKENARW